MGHSEVAARSSSIDRPIEQSGYELLAIPMRTAEHHHSVLDRQRVQMVQHHMVRLRKQRRLAAHVRVVEDHLQQMRRQDRRSGATTAAGGSGEFVSVWHLLRVRT